VGSLAKVLQDLEDVPKFSSWQIFPSTHMSPLFDALLEESNVCKSSLPPSPEESVPAKSLPCSLNFQLDNACLDNKNRYTLCFFLLLVVNGVFWELYINLMLVGHTHNDIDALFGR
jgi:hypothetical protein